MNAVIILAGGKGERFGSSEAKQFIQLGSKTIIEHTIDAFYYHEEVDVICLTVPSEKVNTLQGKYSTYYKNKKILVVNGGKSRQASTSRTL